MGSLQIYAGVVGLLNQQPPSKSYVVSDYYGNYYARPTVTSPDNEKVPQLMSGLQGSIPSVIVAALRAVSGDTNVDMLV